jgi:hypothetical protein
MTSYGKLVLVIIAAVMISWGAMVFATWPERKGNCLTDAKETATVLEAENFCMDQTRCNRGNDYWWGRLRVKRDADSTVCTIVGGFWSYKTGDKVRGPL